MHESLLLRIQAAIWDAEQPSVLYFKQYAEAVKVAEQFGTDIMRPQLKILTSYPQISLALINAQCRAAQLYGATLRYSGFDVTHTFTGLLRENLTLPPDPVELTHAMQESWKLLRAYKLETY